MGKKLEDRYKDALEEIEALEIFRSSIFSYKELFYAAIYHAKKGLYGYEDESLLRVVNEHNTESKK